MEDKPHRAEPAWPIVGVKDHKAPSVFRPESLLREARRQRQLPLVAVPEICVLDPDGDVVRHLKRTGAGRIHEGWACYHTELLAFDLDGIGEVGIVGCAVGAPFAVLVAEQLFASGCRLLISVTSAGQITPIGPTPYFVLIDRALRDEGTSYHYQPGSTFAEAPDTSLLDRVERAGRSLPEKLHRGSTWTTVMTFSSAQDDNTYRRYTIDLSAFPMTSAFQIAFDAQMSNTGDEWYIDKVELISSPVNPSQSVAAAFARRS